MRIKRIRRLYLKLCPKYLRMIIRELIIRKRELPVLNTIIDYYADIEKNSFAKEIKFIKKRRRIEMLPYEFISKYKYNIKIFFDCNNKLKYVIANGQRLYFPIDSRNFEIQKMYLELRREQDEDSPHRYLTPNFNVCEGDILIDVGAAEGIFSLEVVKKCSKLYIFECDERWIKALDATFKPWIEKVEIINKFVANSNDGNKIILDEYIPKLETNSGIFLKIDAEGAEKEILEGANKMLQNNKLKVACCTYHRQNDFDDLKEIFDTNKFSVEASAGYILTGFSDGFVSPFFRKGIIRAVKL